MNVKRSWRCWIQANFAVFVLLVIVIISLAATISLMHEEMIADKYVTWLEGVFTTAMTSLAVAMKSGGAESAPPEPPPAPIVPIPPAATPQKADPQ